MKQASIGSVYNFQPCQIVCLEDDNARLYAEVIHVVTARQVCWVRPLMLAVEPKPMLLVASEQAALYDLRQGADLFWPIARFRPALDTEVIPLLVHLDAQGLDGSAATQQLRDFLHQVWQAHQKEL